MPSSPRTAADSPTRSKPSQPEADTAFDISSLGELVRRRRGALSIRQAADEAGVSFSTLARVESGSQPDLATFTRLCGWLGVTPGQFFRSVGSVAERPMTPLDQAVAQIRADPALDDRAASMIADMMHRMYDQLAHQIATPAPVACHLRAKAVMRPGVPTRLSTLLQTMHDRLTELVEAGEL